MKRKWLIPFAVLVLVAGASAFVGPEIKPQYAWLVFGPEGHVRLNVRLEGEALTLERFVDGKSTERKDHFKSTSDCMNFSITDPNGKTTYVITSIHGRVDKPGGPTQLMASVDIKGPIEYHQYCDLEMKEDSDKARQAHFHGPLAAGPVTIMWKVPPKIALIRGDKPTDLPALVGTMNAEKGCWVVVRSHTGMDEPAFPKGIYPFVDVEFPAKVAGAPSIKKRYPLDQVC